MILRRGRAVAIVGSGDDVIALVGVGDDVDEGVVGDARVVVVSAGVSK